MATDEPDDEPRRARRIRDERDDGDDDRPRRRRSRRDEDDYESGDATGGLIPYKNGMALAGYYCGVASLLPALGLVLGIITIVFCILGIRHRNRHPAHGGMAHAIVGILLGTFGALYNWIFLVLILLGTLR